MKRARFEIANNPLRPHEVNSIVHRGNPISIIDVYPGHIVPDMPHEHYRHYDYTAPDGTIQPYTFVLFHCFTTLVASDEENASMVNKLFRNAWHYYMECLKIK